MEITLIFRKAFLAAPCIEGVVQEGVYTFHGRVKANGIALCQMQLDDHIAALKDVELLGFDVGKAVGSALAAPGGQQEGVGIIKHAEGHVIEDQAHAHQGHDDAADEQTHAAGDTGEYGENAENHKVQGDGCVALAVADGESGLVLGLAPEVPGVALVKEKSDTEGGAGYQKQGK